jgi:3-isopropylmalate/(R)-2-methylmalate dehydratase large subunit
MAVTVNGSLPEGVTAKDLVLTLITHTGTGGGQGYIVEYRGQAIEELSMEGRMTVCNMSIEWGARAGMVAPDETTFAWFEGRPGAPGDLGAAVEAWRALPSDEGAVFDREEVVDAAALAPQVTWGTHPGMVAPVTGRVPEPGDVAPEDADGVRRALEYMGLAGGEAIEDIAIDAVFIGSCTNGRLSDLREAAHVVAGHRVASHVRALVVPGSQKVAVAAEKEGLDQVFRDAGFEWRGAGCSMCLAMNPDRLEGREVCASSSNRNFKGRQGSPTGRTLLMSPAMVAAAAVAGEVVDIRSFPINEPAAV